MARIHSLLGARYLPFLGTMNIEPETVEVISHVSVHMAFVHVRQECVQ